MKYPTHWVLEYAPAPWSAEELAERLTMSGSEVEHMRDGVMEVKVTPNRGDTLSMIGLAREVSALSGVAMQYPDLSVPEWGPDVNTLARVDIEAPDLCPRYAARVVRNVKIGPSPEWLANRIEAAGLRSISNVVDVTNYVMLEFGQPLHAFDYALLQDHRIIVRRALPGETITTIDGVERALGPDMLVIADAKHAVAVAGVMGGSDSEISDTTTDVLLESACFDALSVRRTAKGLGMSTDASYRFERGVDPNGVARAIDRAAMLLAELAGGEVAKGVVDVYPVPVEPWTLTLRPARCNALLGTEFTTGQMVDALAALNMAPAGADPISVTVPTYRPDIHREDDLAEEVCRMVGYDFIPATAVRGEHLNGGISAWERFRRSVHETALACDWQEAVTSTLVDEATVNALGFTATARLSNPLSREVNVVRPSLLPGLVDTVRRNLRQGRGDLGFFEVGRTYYVKDNAPGEDWKWAAAVLGPPVTASWTGTAAPADFYTLKGALDAALARLGAPAAVYEPCEQIGFHPGRCAAISLNGRPFGIIGEVHPDAAGKWDITGRLILFEVDVAALHHAASARRFEALPRFPTVARDISFVVNRDVPQERIAAAITRGAGALLKDLTLFDVFRGERLGPDVQSMAYRLTLRADDRTLSDAEAVETMDNVRAALAADIAASFR
ncbi:MAG TPA: phenylalanine--tRNA ligase subunit beta [Armatimonadota bacterium]|jgi:phenylalanyl-tRNA synthetase beta chain